MDLESTREFLGALGVHNLFYAGGDWGQSSCPMAPITHVGGKDSKPSFGITIGDDSPHYNCFTCGKGRLSVLVAALEMHVQRRPELAQRYPGLMQARQILEADADDLKPLPPYREFTPEPYTEFQEWPDYVLMDWPSALIHAPSMEYAMGRGLTAETIEHFELCYDPKKDMIVAPYRSAYGKLAGARGRGINDKKFFDYTWNTVNNAGHTWFNEQCLNLDGPVVMVEGQFDCMRAAQYYPKVVALLSSQTTQYKLRKLIDSRTVVLMLDNDATGERMIHGNETTPGLLQYFSGKGIEVGMVEYPEGIKDPGEAPEEWLKETLEPLKGH